MKKPIFSIDKVNIFQLFLLDKLVSGQVKFIFYFKKILIKKKSLKFKLNVIFLLIFPLEAHALLVESQEL
jgi:hypothetical protein